MCNLFFFQKQNLKVRPFSASDLLEGPQDVSSPRAQSNATAQWLEEFEKRKSNQSDM